jgi:hypothetical protein
VSRGGRRRGAGRPSKLSPVACLLIGARAETLLSHREVLRDNPAIPYDHLDAAQAQLNMIPLDRRRGYPTPMLRWVRNTLDNNAGRCITGKAPGFNETIERVAKEASRELGTTITPKQVRGCLTRYRKTKGL